MCGLHKTKTKKSLDKTHFTWLLYQTKVPVKWVEFSNQTRVKGKLQNEQSDKLMSTVDVYV